jgi:hypothetical protein
LFTLAAALLLLLQTLNSENMEDYVGYELPAKFLEVDEVRLRHRGGLHMGMHCCTGRLAGKAGCISKVISACRLVVIAGAGQVEDRPTEREVVGQCAIRCMSVLVPNVLCL